MKSTISYLGLFLSHTLLLNSWGSGPQPNSADTFEPPVTGECSPSAERIEIKKRLFKSVGASYIYQEACKVFRLWVPDGSQLKIGISDFKVGLDLYLNRDLIELNFGDHTQWESYGPGKGDELITIQDPSGYYYIWVCTVEGSAADFTLYSEFTP